MKFRANAYHVKQMVYLLDRMKAIREADGSLLDHSMMVMAADLRRQFARSWSSDGGGGGRANGQLKPSHVRYAEETPVTNLYMSMLEKMGVPVESMGDSTGKLDLLSPFSAVVSDEAIFAAPASLRGAIFVRIRRLRNVCRRRGGLHPTAHALRSRRSSGCKS